MKVSAIEEPPKEQTLLSLDNPTARLLVALDGTVLGVNECVRRLLGYAPAELLNRPWQGWIHEDDRAWIEKAWQEGDESRLQIRVLKKSGSVMTVFAHALNLQVHAGSPMRLLTLEDMRHDERHDHHRRLAECVLDVLNRPDYEGRLLHRVVEHIRQFMGLEAVAIRLSDGGRYPTMVSEGFSEDFLRRLKRNLKKETDHTGQTTYRWTGACLCGAVWNGETDPSWPCATEGGSCWTNYLPRLLRRHDEQDLPLKLYSVCCDDGYQSMAIVPVKTEHRILGILHLCDARPDVFDAESLALFESIGRSIGAAMERERTRNALQRSEARFFHLFSHMSNGVMICRTVDEGNSFICTQINDAFERMARSRRDQLVGQNILRGFPGMDQFGLIEVFRRVWRTGVPEHKPLALYGQQGLEMWIEDYIFKLPTGEVAAVLDDVTARKRAESRLQASYKRARELERMVNESPAVCFGWAVTPQWPVTFVTDNIRQFGYERSDLLGGHLDFAALLHPDDRDRVLEAMRDCAGSDTPSEFTAVFRLLTHAGEVRWLDIRAWANYDEDGQVSHLQGIALDVTEHKLADLALEQQYRFVQMLIDTIPSPVFFKDDQGLYLGCNTAFGEFLGLPLDQIIGKTVYDVAPPELARTYEEMDHRLLEEGGTQVYESKVRFADGSLRDILFTKAVFARGDNPSAGMVGVMLDITPQRRMEEERRQAEQLERQSLELADRLHALGMLASGMAHEINNPLQGMMSHLNAVRKSLPERFDQADSIAMVEQGIETIAGLVRQLLMLGHPRENAEDYCAFGEALQFVLQLMDHQLKRSGIKVVCSHIDREAQLAVSQNELTQVLLNFILNARDAMPEGGTLTVRMETPEDDRIRRVTVTDTGAGMTEEELSHAFSPFYTTKGARGTGLGLTVAESIVRNHGGKLEALSEPGKGSSLIMTLPIVGIPEKEETSHE